MKTIPIKRWLQAGLACLILTAGAVAGYGQTTNYPFTFNTAAGVTNYWGTQQNGGIASWTNDAPAGGHSTGCLLFKGPAGTADIGIATTQGVGITNYSGYNTFQFDVKIEPPQFGTISGFNMWFGFGGGTFEVATNFNVTGTNNGWQHFVFPVALIDGNNSNNLSNLKSLTFQVYDGNYGSTNMVLGMDNFMFTSGSGGSTNPVTPQFSGLSSHTITYGASSVGLTGTVSTNGAYLPNGTAITVTVNGNAQQTAISDSTGDFSINYNTTGLPASATPYTVAYSSAAASGFNAATNTSTTLTVNKLPVVLTGTRAYDGTTTAAAAILTVSNRVGSDSVTLSGSAGLAGSGVGLQAVTSFGGLTLGGTAAANYTLTGASGTVTITRQTPIFSGLSSHTITNGTASVTLTGIVSTNGVYPPNGTVITVTINGNAQQTTISDSTGDFSINYNTTGLPANTYTVTYSSAVTANFNAATNAGTTLTVSGQTAVTPQFSGLSSHTITNGTPSLTLTGTVSTNGAYLPSGTVITVTISTNTQTTTISDSTGDFSINFNTASLPANTYTVTYSSAAAPGFNAATNASTTLTVNPVGSQVTTYIYTFFTANDIRNWGPYSGGSGGATASFKAGDAPGAGPSTGCLVWTELFTSSATAGGIAATNTGTNSTLTYLNVTNCTAFEFDLKIPTNSCLDSSSKLTQFQPILLYGPGGSQYAYSGAEIDLTRQSTNNGWQHFIITNSYLGGSANWTQIKGVVFHSQYDGGFAANNTSNTIVEFANVKFTGGSSSGGSTNTVTPQFSNLASSTLTTYGTAGVSLSGKVSTNSSYLPSGTAVTVTVNANAQQTTISDSTGDFSLGYNTVGIPANTTPYAVKYTSAAASGFNPATNTGTTMTINKLPVVLSGTMVANGTTTVPASDLTVANLVSGDNLTLSGSVQIAGTNVGPENITSFGGLTLGGSSAANYTLTGASGTVTLTSGSSGTNAVPPLFFGLHGMGYGSSPYPVPYQPYGLIRTWDHWGNGNINWSGLEPSKGTFTWSAMDATVNAITNSNVAILHCFGGGPAWAGGNSPTNIQDWDDFITAFVNRYHTRIKYLETWNESAPGEGFYTGTTAELVKMCNDLESITKSIDPTVTVLMPDATGGSNNIAIFYNGYFAAGGTNADAIAFHGYCASAGSSQITPPEEIIGIVTQLKDAMNAHGQGSKPIFCTEGDWGTEGTGANQPTTNDAVAFVARHYLLMWSLGISSYAWYDWENNNGSWQWGQMWDPTTGLNAAGVAYQQLYGWMVGATMSQPYSVQGSVYTMGFTRPGGYQALAVWNTSSTSTFNVPNGYIQYRDLAGNLSSVGSTVTIGIKPILLENKSP